MPGVNYGSKLTVVHLTDHRPQQHTQLLEQLFNQHSAGLRTFMLVRLNGNEDCEDIIQDIFYRLSRMEDLADKLEKHTNPRAYTSATILSDSPATSAIYIDDLPSLQRWGAWTNTDPNTYDVERVETANIELDYSSTEGGDDSHSVSGMVNVPLVDERLALRLVAYTREDGGYIDNIRRNEENVNSGSTEGARVMLAYNATDKLDLRLAVTYQADEVDDGSATFRDAADGGRYEYNGVTPEFSTGLSVWCSGHRGSQSSMGCFYCFCTIDRRCACAYSRGLNSCRCRV